MDIFITYKFHRKCMRTSFIIPIGWPRHQYLGLNLYILESQIYNNKHCSPLSIALGTNSGYFSMIQAIALLYIKHTILHFSIHHGFKFIPFIFILNCLKSQMVFKKQPTHHCERPWSYISFLSNRFHYAKTLDLATE